MTTWYWEKVSGTCRYKSGTWPTASDTAGTMKQAFTAMSAGDTLVLGGGTTGITYSGTTDIADSFPWDFYNKANTTIRTALSTDPEYSSHNGIVTLDIATANVHGFTVNSANMVFSGRPYAWPKTLRIGNSVVTSGKHIFTSANSRIGTFNDIEFFSQNRAINDGGVALVFNRCYFKNIPGYVLISSANSVFNFCIFQNYGGLIVGTGSPVFNNPIFDNALGTGAYTVSLYGAGTPTVNNPIVVSSPAHCSYPIYQDGTSGGLLTVNNPLVGISQFRPSQIYSGNVTINNALPVTQPGWIKGRYPAIVIIEIDAHSEMETQYYYDVMAPKLEAYGWRGTINTSTGPLQNGTAASWVLLQELFDRGHEIASHAKTHTVMTRYQTPILSLRYIGAAGTATYTVSNGHLITTVGGVQDLDIDLATGTDATHTTPLTLCTAIALANFINAHYSANYTAAELNGDTNTSPLAIYLADGTGDIKTSAVSLSMDQTRFLNGELLEPLQDIAAHITGIDPTKITYAAPSNTWDSGTVIQDALLGYGYYGARGKDTVSASMASINVFDIPFMQVSYHGEQLTGCLFDTNDPTTAQVHSTVGSRLTDMQQQGGVFVIFVHGLQPLWPDPADLDCTSAAWDKILDEIAASGVQVMTRQQAIAYIKQGADSGDHKTFTNTLVDQSDYHLRPGSPLIGAGTTTPWIGLPNVRDFYGNPITDAAGNIATRRGTVSIGVCQYQYRDEQPLINFENFGKFDSMGGN